MALSKKAAAEQCARAIVKTHMAFRQFIQSRLKTHQIDLTFEMLQVLGVLWKADGVNQQLLADATLKDKASMTYLLNNLAKRNLIARQEDATDRRNKLVLLTKEGKKLQQVIQPWLEEMYQLAGNKITAGAFFDTIQTLEAVERNVTG